MTLNWRGMVVASLAIASLCAACSPPTPTAPPSRAAARPPPSTRAFTTEDALAFEAAVVARDWVTLRPWFSADSDSWQDGALTRDAEQFLYKGDARMGTRSFVQIAGGEAQRAAVVVPQPDGSVTVLFAPKSVTARLGNLEFLGTAWLHSYFACEFQRAADRWVVRGLCFIDSGGPYPIEED